MQFQAMFVKVNSLKMYLSGIRWQHEIGLGHIWTMDGDPYIRKVMRFLKKRYGSNGKAFKVPITLDLVLLMAKHLHGWPDLHKMAHNDRVFLAASVVGVLGFLRGGEFLHSPGSSRPVLLHEQVVCMSDSVRVGVVRPKAQWYDLDVPVRCFTPSIDCPLDPVKMVTTMRALTPVALEAGKPAFRMADGKPLSKRVMLKVTGELLAKCGVIFTDSVGRDVPVKASSWRSGGVQTARAAGISDPVIMAMGRWSSIAWERYSVASEKDLQGAAKRMWAVAEKSAQSGCRRVGAVDADGVFSEDSNLASSLKSITQERTGVASRAMPSRPLVSEVVFPRPILVGSIVKTKWGDATVSAICDDGDLECTWGEWEGAYRLSGPST